MKCCIRITCRTIFSYAVALTKTLNLPLCLPNHFLYSCPSLSPHPEHNLLALQSVNVNLCILSPRDKSLCTTRRQGEAELMNRVLESTIKLPVVFLHQVTQEDLDLVGGKKSPRTRVQTVAESHVRHRCAYQMSFAIHLGVSTHPEESIPVKLKRVWIYVGVHHRAEVCHAAVSLLEDQSSRKLDLPGCFPIHRR